MESAEVVVPAFELHKEASSVAAFDHISLIDLLFTVPKPCRYSQFCWNWAQFALRQRNVHPLDHMARLVGAENNSKMGWRGHKINDL